MNPNVKLLGDRLLLRPSQSEYRGAIAIPQSAQQATSTCEVVSVGTRCHPSLRVGRTVFCQVGFGDRANTMQEDGSFLCSSNHIFGMLNGTKMVPLGFRILILRDTGKFVSSGGIHIPENRRSQSLDGWVMAFGIPRTNQNFKYGMAVGDRIRLAEWNENMVEVNVPMSMIRNLPALPEIPEGNNFGLIVDEKDCVFKWT
jgi:co-chaperonin GroES (HSP10)